MEGLWERIEASLQTQNSRFSGYHVDDERRQAQWPILKLQNLSRQEIA
jgi:hypothetical protein